MKENCTADSECQNNDMVAIMPNREQYCGKHWIGKIIKIQGNEVTIQWYKGSITTPWRPDRNYKPAIVDICTVIGKITLTPSSKLDTKSEQL